MNINANGVPSPQENRSPFSQESQGEGATVKRGTNNIQVVKNKKRQTQSGVNQSASQGSLAEKKITLPSSQDGLKTEEVINTFKKAYNELNRKGEIKEDTKLFKLFFGDSNEKKISSWLEIIEHIIEEKSVNGNIELNEEVEAARLIVIAVHYYIRINESGPRVKETTQPVLNILQKMYKEFYQLHGFEKVRQLANLQDCTTITNYRQAISGLPGNKSKCICFSSLGHTFADNTLNIPDFIAKIKRASDSEIVDDILGIKSDSSPLVEPQEMKGLKEITSNYFMSPGILNAIFFHNTPDSIKEIADLNISAEYKHLLFNFRALKERFYNGEETVDVLVSLIENCCNLQFSTGQDGLFFPVSQLETDNDELENVIDFDNLPIDGFIQFMMNLITTLTLENDRDKNHVTCDYNNSRSEASSGSYNALVERSVVNLRLGESVNGIPNRELQPILQAALKSDYADNDFSNPLVAINPEKFELLTLAFDYDYGEDDLSKDLMKGSCGEIKIPFYDITQKHSNSFIFEKVSTTFISKDVSNPHTATSIKHDGDWLLFNEGEISRDESSDTGFNCGDPVAMTFKMKRSERN